MNNKWINNQFFNLTTSSCIGGFDVTSSADTTNIQFLSICNAITIFVGFVLFCIFLISKLAINWHNFELFDSPSKNFILYFVWFSLYVYLVTVFLHGHGFCDSNINDKLPLLFVASSIRIECGNKSKLIGFDTNSWSTAQTIAHPLATIGSDFNE